MTSKPRGKNWRPRFIEVLRNSGNVRASCTAAGVSRAGAYRARSTSAAFAASWDEALADAVDTLEAAAWTRARAGTSDGLLMWLLKAHRRDFYGDKIQITITHDQRVASLVSEGFTQSEAEAAVEEAERIATTA